MSITSNVRPFLHIVQARPSQELIDTLQWLLQEAVEGKLIGLAYGGIFPQRQFIVDVVGVAHRDPLLTLGIVQMLSREMTDRLNTCQVE